MSFMASMSLTPLPALPCKFLQASTDTTQSIYTFPPKAIRLALEGRPIYTDGYIGFMCLSRRCGSMHLQSIENNPSIHRSCHSKFPSALSGHPSSLLHYHISPYIHPLIHFFPFFFFPFPPAPCAA